jgi:serine/threonine protein phosphatase PrpC
LDLALQSVGEQLVLAEPTNPRAIEQAIEIASSDVGVRKDLGFGLTHDCWTISIAQIVMGWVRFGHIGVCGIYICRSDRLEKITHDHSIEVESGGSKMRGFVESRTLGFQDQLVDFGCVEFGSSDVLLILSPGVIASVAGEELYRVVDAHRKNMEAIVNRLLSLSSGNLALDVAVVAATSGGACVVKGT